MTVILQTADLKRALGALKLWQTKTKFVILSHVLLSRHDRDHVSVGATDLDSTCVAAIPATISAGATDGPLYCVPYTALTALTASAPRTLTLAPDGDGFILVTTDQGTSARVPCLPTDDWPPAPPEIDAETHIRTTTAELLDMLARVAPAMSSTEGTKPRQRGVLLERTDAGRLRAVTTDGHRLLRLDGPPAPAAWPSIIVPACTTIRLLRCLPKTETLCVLSADAREVRVTFSASGVQYVVTSKTVEGPFPDYQRVCPLPESQNVQVELLAEDLIAALAHAAPPKRATRGRTQSLDLVLSTHALRVTHTTDDIDYQSHAVPARLDGAESIVACFDRTYITSMVTTSLAGAKRIRIATEVGPRDHYVQRPVTVCDPDAPDRYGILTPIRGPQPTA